MTRYTLRQAQGIAFTGQYSYMDDPSTPASEGFGLMHYGARMYDPALGRFTSADTIVPGGVQGLDRYAYVNNSPLNYVDPSGHEPKGEGSCYNSNNGVCFDTAGNLTQYGISFSGNWKQKDKSAVNDAVIAVGQALASAMETGVTPADAFREVYGLNDGDKFKFEWVERTCEINDATCWGYTPGANHIEIYETYNGVWDGQPYIASTPVSTGLILHELGHAFNQRLSGAPMAGLTGELLSRPSTNHGFFDNHYEGQYSHDTSQSEIFADMFLGWTVSRWGDNDLGDNRRDYMEGMNAWALNASQLP